MLKQMGRCLLCTKERSQPGIWVQGLSPGPVGGATRVNAVEHKPIQKGARVSKTRVVWFQAHQAPSFFNEPLSLVQGLKNVYNIATRSRMSCVSRLPARFGLHPLLTCSSSFRLLASSSFEAFLFVQVMSIPSHSLTRWLMRRRRRRRS